MFIQMEAMPDPAMLRFLPGRTVLAEGTLDLCDKAQATASPLAERLFAIAGVSRVGLGMDDITVTLTGADWKHLKPAILGVIMDHFMLGTPILRAPAAPTPTYASPQADAETAVDSAIRDSLRLVIDPELGYNIVDLGLIYAVDIGDGGVVTVTMTTTTPGCPATDYLKAGAGEATGSVEGVEFVDVKLTYEPRWTPEMMTPEAKAHFGIDDGGGW